MIFKAFLSSQRYFFCKKVFQLTEWRVSVEVFDAGRAAPAVDEALPVGVAWGAVEGVQLGEADF